MRVGRRSTAGIALTGALILGGVFGTAAPAGATSAPPAPKVTLKAPCSPDDTGHVAIPKVSGVSYQAYEDGWFTLHTRTVGQHAGSVSYRAVNASKVVVGGPWRVTVTFDNGSTKSCSFTKSPRPTISGSITVGHTVKAVRGTWLARREGFTVLLHFTYQWRLNGKAVKGATKRTFRISRADRGRKLTVRVKASGDPYPYEGSRTSKAGTVRSG